VPADAVRTLRAGEVWSEGFDVRSVCWGRALTALSAGGELGGTLGSTRSHTGARPTGAGAFRAATIPFAPIVAVPPPPAPTGDVRIALAPSDAITGGRVSFRVTVRATRAVRAWVRPDHVRFRVRAPDGRDHLCAIEAVERAPIPDLFQRIGTRSGPAYSLEARAYCAPSVFAAAGIYEVTPILVLDVDGSEWRMDTPRGTFEGVPAPVRVRSTTR
jgi:hypothetical protein